MRHSTPGFKPRHWLTLLCLGAALSACTPSAPPTEANAKEALTTTYASMGTISDFVNFKVSNCKPENKGYRCDTQGSVTVQMGPRSTTMPLEPSILYTPTKGTWVANK